MATRTFTIVVGPTPGSDHGGLNTSFTVPDLTTSFPHTVLDTTLSDGTPVKIEEVKAPTLSG